MVLVGLRLLGVRRHNDGTAETHLRLPAGNAVNELGAAAAGRTVVHQDVEIHLFVGLAKVQRLDMGFRSGAHKVDRDVDILALPGQYHVLQVQDLTGFHPMMGHARFARCDIVIPRPKAERISCLERIDVLTVSHG